MTAVQFPTIILPTAAPFGTEMETINNLLEHTSIEIPLEFMQEKQIHIAAMEVVGIGVPGNLWCWVELSPVPSTTSTAYWAAIGGGGGVLAPVAPLIEVPTGVNGVIHSIILPWSIYSRYARLVVRTPVAAAPTTAFWSLQSIFAAKG